MEHSGNFKKSLFGGFKRKDVLAYIDEMTQEHHASEQELVLEIDNLKKKSEELGQEIQGTKNDNKTLAEELLLKQQENEKFLSDFDELKKEIESLKFKLESAHVDIDVKTREMNSLKEQNRQFQFRAEALEIKNKKYDQFNVELSDMLLESKHVADGIVSNAKSEAEEILDRAKKRAKDMTRDADNAVQMLGYQLTNLEQELSDIKKGVSSSTQKLQIQIEDIEKTVIASKQEIEEYKKNIVDSVIKPKIEQEPMNTANQEFFR
ncbi:MAG: hypothetical protein K0R90_2 [Oscillospiraceae bacterium]|jgi:chromosome segregation ATPase|nr:hypothetical protein [Oscillospiraceae bacterium]